MSIAGPATMERRFTCGLMTPSGGSPHGWTSWVAPPLAVVIVKEGVVRVAPNVLPLLAIGLVGCLATLISMWGLMAPLIAGLIYIVAPRARFTAGEFHGGYVAMQGWFYPLASVHGLSFDGGSRRVGVWSWRGVAALDEALRGAGFTLGGAPTPEGS